MAKSDPNKQHWLEKEPKNVLTTMIGKNNQQISVFTSLLFAKVAYSITTHFSRRDAFEMNFFFACTSVVEKKRKHNLVVDLNFLSLNACRQIILIFFLSLSFFIVFFSLFSLFASHTSSCEIAKKTPSHHFWQGTADTVKYCFLIHGTGVLTFSYKSSLRNFKYLLLDTSELVENWHEQLETWLWFKTILKPHCHIPFLYVFIVFSSCVSNVHRSHSNNKWHSKGGGRGGEGVRDSITK